MNTKQKRFLYLFISIIIFIFLLFLSNKYTSEEITEYILKAGIYAPLLYITIQVLGQIFAPFSSTILFIAGFIMFGEKVIWYFILIWMITSITNFFIAKKYGKRALKFFLGDKGLEIVDEVTNELNNRQYYFLRLITFFMNDFASYAFGLTKISFLNYITATIVSIIPWTLIMFKIISAEDSILITTLKVFSVMIPFSVVSYLLFKRISLRRLFKEIIFRLQNRGK